MGQHLAIGFPYQIFVTPEKTYNQTVSLEEVREEMERSLYYDMGLFEAEEGEKTQVFTLKNQPLKDGLLPFLESFYPTIYEKEHVKPDDDREYPFVLETLRTTPFEQWLDFARGKSNYAFQLGTHTSLKYMRIQKVFSRWYAYGLIVYRCTLVMGRSLRKASTTLRSFSNSVSTKHFQNIPL